MLGLVQGLTEFLPVSSSGHLVIAGALLGVHEENLAFSVTVHFATLLAVLIALKEDWYPIVLGLLGRPEHRESARNRLLAVVVGSIPVAAVGLILRDLVSGLFGSPAVAASMLLVTGAILWVSDSRMQKDGRSMDELNIADALLIGCGQAIAIIPGISRSGSTIAAGLLRGLDKEGAARFAFLLAIPAILGATLLEIPDILGAGLSGGAPLVAGALAAGLSGYAAIALFLRFLKKGSLRGFAVYTWAAGLLALYLVLGR